MVGTIGFIKTERQTRISQQKRGINDLTCHGVQNRQERIQSEQGRVEQVLKACVLKGGIGEFENVSGREGKTSLAQNCLVAGLEMEISRLRRKKIQGQQLTIGPMFQLTQNSIPSFISFFVTVFITPNQTTPFPWAGTIIFCVKSMPVTEYLRLMNE